MECQDALYQGFYAGLILMATLHGFLLASILLFHQKLNAKANKFLSLSIFGISIILGYEAMSWLDVSDFVPSWMSYILDVLQYIPYYIRTTIPVGIFYFVIFLINPKHSLTPFEKIGSYALILEVILDLLNIPIGWFFSENVLEITEHYIFLARAFLSIITCGILFPWAIKKVNHYQTFIHNNYSTTHKKSLQWLRNFLMLLMLSLILWGISFT